MSKGFFKSSVACFLAFQLLVPSIALADDAIPSAPPLQPGEQSVGAAISPMKKGQVAPFTGVLFSPEAVATVVAQIHAFDEQVKAEVEHARAQERATCDFRLSEAASKYKADLDIADAKLIERNQRIAVLVEQLREAEDARGNMPLWVGLGSLGGFLVGAGLSALTVYTVTQSSK